MIHDLDGTFSERMEKTTLVKNFNYFVEEEDCTPIVGHESESVLGCGPSIDITVIRVRINNYWAYLYIRGISDIITDENSTTYTEGQVQQFPKAGWDKIIPVVANRSYEMYFSGSFPSYMYLYKQWYHPLYPGDISIRFPYTFTNLQSWLIR